MDHRNERGQATTEYILLLVLAFILFGVVSKNLKPVFSKLAETWSKQIESRFSKNVHRYR